MTNSQSTNIYHQILKLPRNITEPDAYELLGVPRFEPDLKKIKGAAMDRNSLLQRMQNAENYEAVKRLEREVGEAMVCLTNPEKKAEYDRSLVPNAPAVKPPPVPLIPDLPPLFDDPPLSDLPPLFDDPPLAAEQPTQTFARFNEPTVEVAVLPDDPVEDVPHAQFAASEHRPQNAPTADGFEKRENSKHEK